MSNELPVLRQNLSTGDGSVPPGRRGYQNLAFIPIEFQSSASETVERVPSDASDGPAGRRAPWLPTTSE